ncbi:MAG: DinB family protein [Candidatus Acidiferrales bacterium]
MTQTTATAAATPAFAPLLAEFKQECAATRRVLERVPGDNFSWQPHPKSLTLGQLALHIASLPGAFAQILPPDTFDIPADAFTFKAPASTAEILETFDGGVSAAEKFIAALTPEAAGGTWTAKAQGRTAMALPRSAALRALLISHSIHHRGQLTVYLRELDVKVPSIYGPSADENPFA